ncbi:DUF5991 domain-containing protein [Bacteroides sp.]
MKKKWILIIGIILFSCVGLGRALPLSDASNCSDTLEASKQKKEQYWNGSYILSIVYGDLDEFSKMGIYYYFDINNTTASITAEGYQTSFEFECTLKEEKDWLLLLYKKTIEASTYVPLEKEGDTIAVITKKQSKYYIQSPIIADTAWNYNVKLLLEKEKTD